MPKNVSTCLLVVADGSRNSELVHGHINLLHSEGCSPGHGKTTILAAGFPALSPETQTPLSPTLFINDRMARLQDDALLQLARAEGMRQAAVNYRSYTREADNRVAIVGSDARRLLDFVDTYGGLLEITPLLLGCHPDFAGVVDFDLEPLRSGYAIDYRVRAPIDHELCNYCGACGPACPERCIDARLHLDVAACTECKECEAACTAGAIDIRGVLAKRCEVGAVIVFGERGDFPDGRRIYGDGEIESYLQTVFPYRVDELVRVEHHLCQYSGRLDAGCDLCTTSCRYGALGKTENGIVVDHFRCTDCGECVAVCPTGALQHEKFGDGVFAEYMEMAPVPAGGTVVYGSADSLRDFWWRHQRRRFAETMFIAVDGGLGLQQIFAAVGKGAARVVLVDDGDSPRSAPLARQLELARDILANRAEGGRSLVICGSGELVDELDKPGPKPLLVAGGVNGGPGRRGMVGDVLARFAATLATAPQIKPRGYVPFATLDCDDSRCSHCGACLNECKTGALVADQQRLSLDHTGVLCVGCGLCAAVCPEDALSLRSEFTLAGEFFASRTMAVAEPMLCRECGKPFGTKKSFARVMAILRSKEAVDTSHFEYCDTCRVTRLFAEE